MAAEKSRKTGVPVTLIACASCARACMSLRVSLRAGMRAHSASVSVVARFWYESATAQSLVPTTLKREEGAQPVYPPLASLQAGLCRFPTFSPWQCFGSAAVKARDDEPGLCGGMQKVLAEQSEEIACFASAFCLRGPDAKRRPEKSWDP